MQQAAPGYQSIPVGSRWDPVNFSSELIPALHQQSISMNITDRTSEVGRCGSTVLYRHEVATAEIQEFQNNGTLKPSNDAPIPCERRLRIDEAFYYNHKYSATDWEKFMCNDQSYIQERVNAALHTGMQEIDKRVLRKMISNVHASNKGANAGYQSNQYNLGLPAAGQFLELNSQNMFAELLKVRNVFAEHNIDMNNAGSVPFAIGPIGLDTVVLANDEYRNKDFTDGCNVPCPTINGVMNSLFAGFQIMTTSCLPKYLIGDDVVYPVLFGFKRATKLMVNFTSRKMENTEVDSLDVHLQGWWHLGSAVIDPRFLTVGFYKITQPGQ